MGRDDRLLQRLFGEPELSGLQSDAYWLALFVGVIGTAVATGFLAFLVLPNDLALALSPFLLVVAPLLAYPVIRVLQRVFLRIALKAEAWLKPTEFIDEPRL